MLAPHDRKDAELREIRCATEDALDSFELVRSQSMPRHQLGSYGRVTGHLRRTLAKKIIASCWSAIRVARQGRARARAPLAHCNLRQSAISRRALLLRSPAMLPHRRAIRSDWKRRPLARHQNEQWKKKAVANAPRPLSFPRRAK